MILRICKTKRVLTRNSWDSFVFLFENGENGLNVMNVIRTVRSEKEK